MYGKPMSAWSGRVLISIWRNKAVGLTVYAIFSPISASASLVCSYFL